MTSCARSALRANAARYGGDGAEAIAARAGLVDAPWARRNVHAWQAVMCRALDKRSEGVRCYLRIRAMRGAHIDSG